MPERIPLIELPRLLRGYGVITSYHTIWAACVAGNFPAERRGTRWLIDPADVPFIAQTFAEQR